MQEGIVSTSGRVVTDASGAILGSVELRDIQRAQVLESIAKFASKRPQILVRYDEIMEIGSAFMADRDKLATALGDIGERIREERRVSGRRLLELLGPNPNRLVVAGKAMTPRQVERSAKTVNLSVYLGSWDFWSRFLPQLSNANAQHEYYLTDVINLAATDGTWKLTQHVLSDATAVMGFNSPGELLQIEDIWRRRALARDYETRDETILDATQLPQEAYRAAGKWLDLFQQWPIGLQRKLAAVYGQDSARERRDLFIKTLKLFIDRFGPGRKAVAVRAPGRINLLGRHVDHRGGAVNVMAIDRDIVFVASPRSDDRVSLCNVDSRRFHDREFSVAELLGDIDWDDWLTYVNSAHVAALLARSQGDWSNYVKASLLRLQQKFQNVRLQGFDAAIAGDIPIAAGLSSSSAMVVAAAEAAIAFNGLQVTPAELVDLCGEGEWFVGSRGGASDHAAIRMSCRGQVSHIKFLPFRMDQVYNLPADCKVIIAHSGLDAHKSAAAKDAYNQKVASYELGFMLLKSRLPKYERLLEHVRDINPRRLSCSVSDIYRALLHVPESVTQEELDEVMHGHQCERLGLLRSSHRPPKRYGLRGVLLYGIAECERSLLAPGMLGRGDVSEFGRLMRMSHDGDRVRTWRRQATGKWRTVKYHYDCSDQALLERCEDLKSEDPQRVLQAQLHMQPGAYGCSLPRIDMMVDIAQDVPGVYGAQLGGAGLGGCVMILCRAEAVEPVRSTLTREYYAKYKIEPLIHVCNPVSGSGLVSG
jgi:N-acetylgalactosamine kinase